MKKNIFSLTILLILGCFVTAAYGVDEATQGAKDNKLEKLQELKEKVAEKVAQLKNEEVKIYTGEIIKIENETIIISSKGTEIKVFTNNQTKFVWLNTDGKKLALSFKNFTKGDSIFTWGLFNKETGVLTAKVVSGRIPLLMFYCTVKSIDSQENVITCQDEKQKTDYRLSLEEKIKILSWSGKITFETTTTEKIKVGSKILVKGVKKDKKEFISPILVIIISLSSPIAPK